MAKLQADAENELRALDERICARELAEKRRLAPGWLDSDARLLEPERKSIPVSEAPSDPVRGYGADMFGGGNVGAEGSTQHRREFSSGGYGYNGYEGHGPGGVSEMAVPDEGEELDRAFGGLALGQGQTRGEML